MGKKMENIYLVKNENILEQRKVSGDHGVVMSLKLEQNVYGEDKQLCLSDHGKWCGIATNNYGYWFLIDTVNQKQFKMQSKVLEKSYAPCFIGGASELIAIGGESQMEIWGVFSRSSVHHITGIGSYVNCTFSVGNMLAVGGYDNMLRLYDVTTWNVIYSKKYEMRPDSLHLTEDQKYLTVAGANGEQCVVIKLF